MGQKTLKRNEVINFASRLNEIVSPFSKDSQSLSGLIPSNNKVPEIQLWKRENGGL